MSNQAQFKPNIKYNIASYEHPENCDKANIIELMKRIGGHISILRGLGIKGVFISFKATQKIDKTSLELLIKELTVIHVRSGMSVGLGDYSHALFPILLQFVRPTSISLFKNLSIMCLAVGTSSKFSSVLLYIEDLDECKSIASYLISRSYFVIIASSLDDMRRKLKYNRDAYDHVIIESYFASPPENVSVNYEKGAFTYTFRGRLDKRLKSSFNIDVFKERLNLGFKVFIFDMSQILHADMHAAYLLIEALEEAHINHASVCLIGLNKTTFNNNAYTILDKSNFWNYTGEIEDVYEDPEIQDKISTQHTQLFSLGISKRIIELMPQLIRATKNILERLDITDIHTHTQQCHVQNKPDIEPYIATHINFSGDYTGQMNFIFPKDSVNPILERKYDIVEELTKKDHIDALKEFSSTIMDKLNANLERSQQAITSDFPKATDCSDLDTGYVDQKYILETFHCDEYPFYVTITDFYDEL